MPIPRRLLNGLVAVSGWWLAATSWGHCQPPGDLLSELQQVQRQGNVPVVMVGLRLPCPDGSTAVFQQTWGASDAAASRWGSITKTVTALTVLSLVDDGEVRLDDALFLHVDQKHWHNPWRERYPIRVVDLLELRTGLTDLSGLEFDHNTPLNLEQALALNPQHRQVRWPPGWHHSYSNLSLGLSQLLIETRTKLSYQAAATQRVLQPLGMQHANFAPREDLVAGFKADGITPIPYWHMTFPAYGALNARLSDLMVLLEYLASEAAPAALFAPQGRVFATEFSFDYASGLYPRVRRGQTWYSHGGDADGYRSRIALLKGTDLGYVVNINTDNPRLLRQLEAVLEGFLVTTRPKQALALTAPPETETETELAPWVGTYYPATVRFGHVRWASGQLERVHIERHPTRPNALNFRRGQRQVALLPLGNGQFRRPDDPEGTVVFFQAEGKRYFSGELGNFVQYKPR